MCPGPSRRETIVVGRMGVAWGDCAPLVEVQFGVERPLGPGAITHSPPVELSAEGRLSVTRSLGMEGAPIRHRCEKGS